MKERFSPHLLVAHASWKAHLRAGDCAIDATCGNGHDTLTLAALLLGHPNSLLIGLDIQQEALCKTEEQLAGLPPEQRARVLLHRRCHSTLDQIPLPFPPRLIVYNLGYLPGANKTITTQTATTLQSLKKGLDLLGEEGALSITCYPGHPEGASEEQAIVAWAKTLPADRWRVCYHTWINRAASPTFLWVLKIK